MLSGKPVIASVDQDSATTRYIHEAGCGLSVNPDSIESLVEGFKSFAQLSLEERIKMGNNSRDFAEKHLTRDVNLKMVCDAIERYL
jgi:hypothetical protein